MDFDSQIERGNKLAPHLQAMISRSHFIDLAMKTKRDYLIRIKQVIAAGMLTDHGYSYNEGKDTLDFIEENQNELRELSLRIALKIASLRGSNPKDWSRIAKITCCKRAA